MKRRLSLAISFLFIVVSAFAAYQQIDFLAAGLTDTSGNPLSGGLVYTYSAGTGLDKATYADADGVTTNPNPIVLDAYGRKLVFGDGRYKFIVKTAGSTTLYTWDGLTYKNISFSSGSAISLSTANQTTISFAGSNDATIKPYFYLDGIKQAENTYTWTPPGTITLTGGAIPLAGMVIEVGY